MSVTLWWPWGIGSSSRHLLLRLSIRSADSAWLLIPRRGADKRVHPVRRDRVVEQDRLQKQGGWDCQQGAQGTENVCPDDQRDKGGRGADSHRVPREPWLDDGLNHDVDDGVDDHDGDRATHPTVEQSDEGRRNYTEDEADVWNVVGHERQHPPRDE